MLPTLLLMTLAVTAAAGWTGQAPQAQPDPKLVRVWVTTEDGGHPEELAARQESLKHLTAALAKRKKLVALVDKEELADVSVAVRERRVEVPRVVLGIGARPGDPPGTLAPARTVQLLIGLSWQHEGVRLTNKNKPIESQLGWSSAADDIAKQIEKWISDRRQRILDGRF